jgi:hypothetical protein
MRFVLISRHTNGAEVPEAERAQNLKDMGEWVTLLKPAMAMPTRGGRIATAAGVEDYRGDIGGVIVFEADSLDHAVELARKSPGLRFGFTHEVLPVLSMEQAAAQNTN